VREQRSCYCREPDRLYTAAKVRECVLGLDRLIEPGVSLRSDDDAFYLFLQKQKLIDRTVCASLAHALVGGAFCGPNAQFECDRKTLGLKKGTSESYKLKKGTSEAYNKCNLQDSARVDMSLHESHDEGGFGVPNNTISRHAAAYTTNAHFVAFLGTFARPDQEVWLPGNDLQDPTTWIVPSIRTLKHLHENLLQSYDCTEQPVANQTTQPSGAGGSTSANAGTPPPPPSAHVQDSSSGTLVLSQLNHLHEAYKRRQDALPESSTSQDQQPTASGPIPSHAAAHSTLSSIQGLASSHEVHSMHLLESRESTRCCFWAGRHFLQQS